MAQTVVTQTTSGNYTWICPPGVTTAQVECWGGGGAGGQRTTNGGGGGGGGGEYAKEATLSVTPGTSYSYTVGAAGVSGASAGNGGSSTFNTSTVVANGGSGVAQNTLTGGAGGTGSTNTTHFTGGAGFTSAGTTGGGGGGSAGTGSNGTTATSATGATAVTGGGPGGTGATTGNTNGSAPASGPGGGGGGADRSTSGTRVGGSGFAGKVVITHTTPLTGALTETFDSQNTAKFTYGAAASVSSGQLQTTVNSSYTGLISSVSAYDLTGSAVTVQVTQLPNVGSGSTEAFLLVNLNSAVLDQQNLYQIGWNNGNTYLREKVAGVQSQTTVSTTDLWWRLSESGGNVLFDTSADGVSWTNRRTRAAGFALTSLYVGVGSGYFGTETTPGTAIFDNVNVLPPVGRKFTTFQAVTRAAYY